MLAVASDRFPRTGAIAISIMGGIGMMSAGLIGSPGLGYAKDRFAGEALKKSNAVAFESYKADKPSKFLVFEDAIGLNGKKLGEAQEKLNKARETAEGEAARATLSSEELNVVDASIAGDRKTLVADSFIPATMAAIYVLLLIYFKTIGGYKPVTIADDVGQGNAG